MESVSRRALAVQRAMMDAEFRAQRDAVAASNDPIHRLIADAKRRARTTKRQPSDGCYHIEYSAQLPARAVRPESAVRGVGY